MAVLTPPIPITPARWKIRNPKEGRNPKSENRRANVSCRVAPPPPSDGKTELRKGGEWSTQKLPTEVAHGAFGFRLSDFLRISGFGFRISAPPRRCRPKRLWHAGDRASNPSGMGQECPRSSHPCQQRWKNVRCAPPDRNDLDRRPLRPTLALMLSRPIRHRNLIITGRRRRLSFKPPCGQAQNAQLRVVPG